MRPYVIRQGDYLTRLGERLGFDPEAVWNDDANRELRERRGSPNMLAPGDVLQVPDEAVSPSFSLRARTTNRYSAVPARVTVNLTLRQDGDVLANEPCEVLIEPPQSVSSDGDGRVTFEVPASCEEVTVRLTQRERGLRVRVGHLDPASEPSGVAARLINMGYLSPDRPTNEQQRELQMHSAIASFQHAHSREVTGELDEATSAALVEAHGS